MGFFSKFLRKKKYTDNKKNGAGTSEKRTNRTADEISIKMVEFNINDLFDDLAKATAKSRNKKKIELFFESEKNVPSKVIGDRNYLGQVLWHLLDNAVDFTDAGKEIRLCAERKYSNLNEIHLRFKITDNGKGIQQKAIDEILTPFFNGQLPSLKEFGIEGRGLFSAREILNKMKGKLSVKAGKEGGSVFMVDIPLFSTDPLNKRHYRLPDNASKILKIKIFDTNRSSASGLKKLFEYFRHEVSAPVSNRLNTVVGIDDYEMIIIPDKLINEKIAAQIRAAKSKKDLKLVLITDSYTHSGKRALELADGQIKKPFTQQMIFQLLINLYAAGQSSSANEPLSKKHILN
ncbi:MAG: hypothetical protein B5M52_03365 [Helicobacteraceae bacterium 4484_230]|nr:MAG: hypothetical protein B5M52_03365 [Helicobacteraceae bacterium 4484_230]